MDTVDDSQECYVRNFSSPLEAKNRISNGLQRRSESNQQYQNGLANWIIHDSTDGVNS